MDQTLFNHTYQEHSRRLLLYARQFTRCPSEAEDAVHEGFLKVFKDGPPPEEERVARLYKAVRWSALDANRKRVRQAERESLVMVTADTSWFEAPLEDRERYQEIEKLLRSLSESQREILVMKIWGELSFRQISDALGVSLNTAASRYRYALGHLRKALEDQETYESVY